MRVSELYGRWQGQECWIVGTGPSLDVFPVEMLREKTCILLNDAQSHLRGVGPIALANNVRQLSGCRLPYQIVKGRLRFDPHPERTDNHVAWNHPKYYVFSYREPVIKTGNGERIRTGDTVSHHDEAQLFKEPDFYWSPEKGSVSAFAVQFALLAGFRAIYLVGCDCNTLSGAEYVDGKTGAQMRRDYEAYQYGLLRLHREAVRRGVSMVSVQPFFGLGWHEQQFAEMKLRGTTADLRRGFQHSFSDRQARPDG